MKTTLTLSFLSIAALSSSIIACSSSTTTGGTGGVPTATGGVSTATGGAVSTGGGTNTGGVGATGSATGGVGATGSATGGVGATGSATGGAGATGGGGATTGASISIDGAWVDATGNTVAIQGAFFILEDSVKDAMPLEDGFAHTDFTADSGPVEDDPVGVSKFGPDTVAPCISGTAASVKSVDGLACDADGSPVMCNWDDFWGGGIGLNLNETGEVDGMESVQSPFDAVAAGIQGFQFSISGEVAGATIRFKATDVPNEGQDFCFEVPINEPNVQVLFTDLKHMCWGSDGVETLDPSQLLQLQWQIVTDPSGDFPITNFCIDNLAWF